MIKIRLIPLLQLYESSVVKTKQFLNHRVVGDAISTIQIFSKRMADEMIIVDIKASKTKKINFPFIKKISRECIMPLTIGGGISCMKDVDKLFECGADKIIINSLYFENKKLIKMISKKYGNQAIVFSMDLIKDKQGYKFFSNSKRKTSDLVNLDAFFKDIKGLGIGEIFLNSVSQDGTMNGYDYNLIKKVTSKINLPVIAAGGCGDKGDCVKAINYGANAVAAGSIFFWVGASVISVKKYMAHKNLNVRLI